MEVCMWIRISSCVMLTPSTGRTSSRTRVLNFWSCPQTIVATHAEGVIAPVTAAVGAPRRISAKAKSTVIRKSTNVERASLLSLRLQ
ncbi:hypothetical protein cypCar_00018387 [Cyprinus carpio]|nr:hypothetical protein cypCar_00018387 [Cyprinus carpio]